MSEFGISTKAADKLATIIRGEFDKATMARNSEKCGSKGLHEVLMDCYNQRNGILSEADMNIAFDLGVDLVVNLTSLKCSALEAIVRDLFTDNMDMPFTIEPTPIAQLSVVGEQHVLANIKQGLLATDGGMEGQELVKFVREMKLKRLDEDNKYATAAAMRMSKLILDQCVEGRFRNALLGFLYNYTTYPFATLLGPIPSRIAVPMWSGNKCVFKLQDQFAFQAVSPFDTFWTSDSPDAQRGTAVLIRRRINPQYLLDASTMPSYRKAAVDEVIKEGFAGKIPPSWTAHNPDAAGNTLLPWNMGDSIEMVTRYGRCKGSDLQEWGITGIEANQTYETVISCVDRFTIQALINPNPWANPRPVNISSFEKIGDRIPGVGVAQKIRDVERAYMATLRGMLNNFGRTLGPIGEVDISRVQRYIDDQWDGSVVSNVLYPVDPDIAGGGRPAHYFHNVPSIAGQAIQIMNYFMELADKISQIPATVHGSAPGSGANRTYRGMMAILGNTMKPIQSSIINLDLDIFAPVGTLLYNLNMRYSQDPEIKGDCKVNARGAAGLLDKEMKKQSAMEALQVIGQLGQNVGLNPKILEQAVGNVLEAMGLKVEGEETFAPQQPQGQPPGQPPAGQPPAGMDQQAAAMPQNGGGM